MASLGVQIEAICALLRGNWKISEGKGAVLPSASNNAIAAVVAKAYDIDIGRVSELILFWGKFVLLAILADRLNFRPLPQLVLLAADLIGAQFL